MFLSPRAYHRLDTRSRVSTSATSYDYVLYIYIFCRWLGYGDKMLHNKFDGSVGFAIDGGVKDAGHMRRLATEHNSPMPTVDVAHNNLLTARALHTAQARTGSTSFPVLDWAALIAGSRVAAGLDAFDAGKACIRRARRIMRLANDNGLT
jgi:hypothetical protein